MTGRRFFTLDYVEHAVLADGTPVRLRLIRPEDKELLRAGFNRLSVESRYARFLAPKASLSDDELRYLCDVDHEHHLAITAARDDQPDGEATGLGIARFIRLADPPTTADRRDLLDPVGEDDRDGDRHLEGRERGDLLAAGESCEGQRARRAATREAWRVARCEHRGARVRDRLLGPFVTSDR